MAPLVCARGLPEKPHLHRFHGAARATGLVAARIVNDGYLLSYGFHSYSQLVQAGEGAYSVSPKLSAVSRRNAWPL
jgi:hypothetical protein